MKRIHIRKIVSISALLLVCAMSVSCKTKATAPFSYEECSNSSMLEPANGIIMNPIIADLEMIGNEKITYKETFSVKMDENSKDKIQIYKNIALAHAEKEYKADVIVGARFEVSATENEIEVTVIGYPAYYKNFRNATKKDRWMLKLYKNGGLNPAP